MAMSAGESQQRRTSSEAVTIGHFRYLRAPRPLHFPEHEQVPETKWHLELKTLVYQFLKVAFADQALIGCDQFVYWDAANPRMCLAPDAFLRFGGPDELFGSWKVWERGAPHVAVEIISDHDALDRNWEAKLLQYRHLGVRELVRFDADATENKLQVWHRVEDDLVEREATGECVQSNVLPGYWLVVKDPKLGPSLRLSHDEPGRALFLTATEADAQRIEADAQRIEADAQRIEAAAQRIEADAQRIEADARRIRELEAELARRQG
jgi:Uma2 family endonuclease